MSGVKIVLLCEDTQTESFVRNFLKHRKFQGRDINTCPLPEGSGAGEQWVRKQYPEELKLIRRRENAYLIVVIDADTGTIDDRHRELEIACREKDISPRDHERDSNVLHIIPRRNIETWLAYLKNDENVDESKDYQSLRDCPKEDLKEYTKSLYDMCHVQQRLREPAPASLREACSEYRRLRRRN